MEWIKCSDMLPTPYSNVLFVTEDNYVSCGKYYGIRNEHITWESDDYVYWDDEVTHWMPLPKPPEVTP